MTARRVGEGLTMADQTYVFLKQFIRFHSPFVFAAKTIKRALGSIPNRILAVD